MHSNHHLSLEQLNEKLADWDKSIDQFTETEGIYTLKLLKQHESNEETKQMKAHLLGLLAHARSKRKGYIDHLAKKWAKQGLELHGKDKHAAEIVSVTQLEALSNVYTTLAFSLIRETDNRPAKRSIASAYIETSEAFLAEAQQYEQLIQTGLDAAEFIHDEKTKNTYLHLDKLLKNTKQHLTELIEAASNYIESLSGTFHSSSYADAMKHAIQSIKDDRQKWEASFQSDTKANSQSCLTELENMIGLERVKTKIRKLYHFLQYQKERKREGYQFKDELSLHMILTGNPGTGKTSLARLIAKIYYELGLLNRPEVIEVNRSHLVGGYVGQTEENVMNVIKQAQGGVLFIDEAYSLHREGQSGNDYGQTAIDTLVSAMTNEEYAGSFAVILAGYPEEMRQFLWSNPGLRSRFAESNALHLDDYSTDELLEIAEQTATENDFILTEGALQEIEKRIEKERVDESFGNARTVKNIVVDAMFKKGSSLAASTELDITDFTIIDREDVEFEESSSSVSPDEQLEQLIGLDEIKKEVKKLASFVKVQQLRREKGVKTVPIQLHSIFSGNPGTGKTTVAEIFSSILKENGLLKRGHLITAGRSDLVAGYVGQTALKTKKKIREALGGVLFIDEAYSLRASAGDDFGKEAIDTLVEEMTKHNENLVVILAGYPNEMKKLLASNPGLSSRFKKFFHFPDYTANELTELTVHYTESYSYQINEQVKSYLLEHFNSVNIEGNGRYVTNLVDEAIQHQAFRLVENNSLSELSYLSITDFKSVIESKERS